MRKMQRDYKRSRYILIPEAQDMNAHENYNKVNEGASSLCLSYVVTVNEREIFSKGKKVSATPVYFKTAIAFFKHLIPYCQMKTDPAPHQN